ncbi:MAG TPA: acyl-CoA dehydrogenase family protein, partial [Microthrixaceae bacterium]|nr:acyl-CoA dehydrogenase family protein [Microthrixaceae bacterium]
MRDALSLAEDLAESVLFPNALETDRSELVPVSNLDALAEAGLYGLFGPESDGGFGADLRTASAVVERIASGCLTTALVWLQHHALVGSLLMGAEPLRSEWLPEVTTGVRRSGIVFTGLIPGPSTLNATRQGDKWVIDGQAPWVSGWGRIDTLQVAARGPEETVVTVALDQLDRPDLTAVRHRLAALDASGTVRLSFDGLVVEDDRVLSIVPHDPGSVNGVSLRLNGSLALGVARRCCSLIGPS